MKSTPEDIFAHLCCTKTRAQYASCSIYWADTSLVINPGTIRVDALRIKKLQEQRLHYPSLPVPGINLSRYLHYVPEIMASCNQDTACITAAVAIFSIVLVSSLETGAFPLMHLVPMHSWGYWGRDACSACGTMAPSTWRWIVSIRQSFIVLRLP